MFPAMRRKQQALSQQEAIVILQQASSGTLALMGKDYWPYAVPLSFVFDQKSLYFHCAKAGYKLEAMQQNPKASFCIIAQDEPVPEEWTTHYKSVIVFGKLQILEEESKRHALKLLIHKYAPESSESQIQQGIEKEWNQTIVLEMKMEHLSGKAAIELICPK